MDINEVDKYIQRIHDKIFKIEKAKKRLIVVENNLALLYSDLASHKSKMNEEHQDVLKLEKKSTLSLFRNILGNQEEQLERERQEYLQAVLEYNSIAHEINLLRFEQEILNKRSKDNEGLNQQLEELIKIKEEKLLTNNAEQASQIKEINGELDHLYKFKRELIEAYSVATKVEKVLLNALSKLKNVKGFNYNHLKNLGQPYSIIRKSFIDDAVKNVSEINYYLSKFDKELSDVYSQYTFFSIYKYQNFVESFYDSLISDWVLQNRVKNATNCLYRASDQTKRVLATLKNDISKTDVSIAKKLSQKSELIRNI